MTSFIRGEKNPLKLGYYVLRNRGKLQETSSPEERDAAESEFFAQERWSKAQLDRDHAGVHALKKRLQQLLVDITRRELPNVRRQINARLDNCRKELKAMGADRKSTVQQQIYLQGMAINFQKITDHALDAYYARNPIFGEMPEMRLPTLVVDRSDKFVLDLAKKGHTIEFDIVKDEEKKDIPKASPNRDEEEGSSTTRSFETINEFDNGSSRSDFKANMVGTPSTELNAAQHRYPELSSLFPDEGKSPEPERRGILDWIESEYRKARGSGLQVISPSV